MGRPFLPKSFLPSSNRTDYPIIQIKPVGQWAETIKTIGRLDPAIKAASIAAQFKVANLICKKVKAHLRNQDLGWAPLSDSYYDEKEHEGLSTKTLMAHGNYYNAIEVWHPGNQHMVYVGVRRGKFTRNLKGKRSKLEIAQIAAIHEFSSGRKIPRRPLWNPSIHELGGAKGIKQLYMGSFLYHLRMAGIPIKQFRNIL